MNKANVREIWFADFPFEEDKTKVKKRPVVVLEISDDFIEILGVKVTSKPARSVGRSKTISEYEVALFYWQEEGLDRPSIVRIDKMQTIQTSYLHYKIGNLHRHDWYNIKTKAKKYMLEQLKKQNS